MTDTITAIRARNPDETRQNLLEAALEEIQTHGFQAASLDQILKRAGVTKGALYHHFKNKKELGYAVVDQLIRSEVTEKWITPLQDCSDPIDTLMQQIVKVREEVSTKFHHGCPLVNIGQEMAKLDEGFRERIESIYQHWIEGISRALSKGQNEGKVSRKVAPDQVASFFVAAAEGTMIIGKVTRTEDALRNSGFAMMHYLDSLRA